MKTILQRLLPQLVKVRHQIHTNPELANGERNTASIITKTLKKYGYQVSTGIAGNGITAVLDSTKPGRTVALRADMDALPLHEQTNLPYQSINKGIMHACGHDGHTVTLLAVAGALTECTQQFKGKIKFIFQPAEEIGTGAAAMIDNGILENPKVDAIFGYHNTPRSRPGLVVTKTGCIMAGQDTFSVTIQGKGGHAAHLSTVIDPIYIGSAIIQAVQSIVSRFTSPIDSVVISVTEFHAGTAYNVTPDEAKLTGTIRTITSESQTKVKEQLKNIVNGIATTFGAKVTIDFYNYFPPTINHSNETELVLDTARQILGDKNVMRLTEPSMASEDFSHYLGKVPGCLFFVGNGDRGPIHSAQYNFNDDIIPIAAEVMGNVAMNYLNKK